MRIFADINIEAMETNGLSKELMDALNVEKQNIDKMSSIVSQIEDINSYLITKGFRYVLQKTESSPMRNVAIPIKDNEGFDILKGRKVEDVIINALKSVGGKATFDKVAEHLMLENPNENKDYIREWTKKNASNMLKKGKITTFGTSRKPYIYSIKEETPTVVADVS